MAIPSKIIGDSHVGPPGLLGMTYVGKSLYEVKEPPDGSAIRGCFYGDQPLSKYFTAASNMRISYSPGTLQ